MKKLSGAQMKELELNLLKAFASFCETNNLYYTLCGGTLLGAIRHHGFIPWDDDIDVLMPRPDYDRLLNREGIDEEFLPDYMKFVSFKDKSLRFPFIKLVDTRTKIDVDFYDPELNVNHIWIDIFPIDGNPSEPKELERLYKKSLRLRKILTTKMAQKGTGKTFAKRILKPILRKLFSGISFERLCEDIDRTAKSYDFSQSEKIGGVVWGYGPQECVDKAAFMTPVMVPFEDASFQAPSNYHAYLTGLYKDYMQLPPEKDRQIHGIHAYMIEE